MRLMLSANQPRKNPRRSRPHARSAPRYNPGLFSRALESRHHGATLRRNFRMGLPDLEARLLSREAGPEEIPGILRHQTQHSGSKFHLPPAGKRNDHSELVG